MWTPSPAEQVVRMSGASDGSLEKTGICRERNSSENPLPLHHGSTQASALSPKDAVPCLDSSLLDLDVGPRGPHLLSRPAGRHAQVLTANVCVDSHTHTNTQWTEASARYSNACVSKRELAGEKIRPRH